MTLLAVEYHSGHWHIRTEPTVLAPIRMGGSPVAAFNAGWRPKFVYVGFAPVYLLELEHENGSLSTWFLDEHFNRIGGELQELTEEVKSQLVGKYVKAIEAPWQSLMVPREPVWPSIVEGFSDVNGRTLAAIDRLARAGREDDVTWHDISSGDTAALTIQNPDTAISWQISADRLATILSMSLQKNLLVALQTRQLSWPSPLTERLVTTVHSVYVDNMTILYRCVDEESQLVFYVCCAGHHMEIVGVLFPTVCRAFYLTPMQRHLADFLCKGMKSRLTQYLLRSGKMLPGYFRQQLRSFANPLWGGGAFHIGHHLWNELSGLLSVVEGVSASCLPNVIIPGQTGEGEAYGRVDLLFPELAPFVIRGIETDAKVNEFCIAKRIQVIRVTDTYVAGPLRKRILDLMRLGTDLVEERRLAKVFQDDGVPVVVLGLRVENRTVMDLEIFCTRVIEYLAQKLGRLAVVVDGHNSRLVEGRTEDYPSFVESRATRAPAEVEKGIAQSLQTTFSGSDVTIVDNISRPMRASLFWVDQSKFFISPWGAGLAKYRWVGNKPGVIVSNRWVLENKGDLHIYDDMKYMESPSNVKFIRSEHVFDFEDAPVLVQVFEPHHPMYFNFKVNMRGLYEEIDNVIEEIPDLVMRRGE